MVVIQKLRERPLWIVQFACILALISVVGGVAISYRLQLPAPPLVIDSKVWPSMRCDDARQMFQQLSADDPVRYAAVMSQICEAGR